MIGRYNSAFEQALGVGDAETLRGLAYESIPEWDSVGHMSLIAALEDEFEITLEMDDVIDFSSYEVGILILRKYGVEI